MKLFKKLKIYNESEIDGAYIGFNILRAKDYERNKFGRLFLWSVNFGNFKFIKKLFIVNLWQKKIS